MILVSLKRIFKAGWQSFSRNLWLSAATIGIMAVTLFVFSNLILFDFFTDEVVRMIRDKIDLSIYFSANVDESEIFKVRDILKQLPEVERVEYISREKALEIFSEKHQSNEVVRRALEELGTNPLQASLNIKAKQGQSYEPIVAFVEGAPFKDSISKINFTENKLIIERLNKIASGIQKFGLGAIIVFSGLAVLIAFNSIRMAIYSFREEINVMRLVGASHWFIRGPFLIMGLVISLIASLATFFVIWLAVLLLAPKVNAFIPDINFQVFFNQNFLKLFFWQTFAGIAIMFLSIYLAFNKYLKEEK
ncbi:MAG: permease-like cell division protein FtsX [Patescibacteria group bacterium]